MILRARLVVPVNRPAIPNGAVVVSRGRIQAVGRWSELRGRPEGRVMDLGETALMPGLINAHCHLDYTQMAGQLPPQKTFPDWIKAILGLKLEWELPDFERSWRAGAEMLCRTGTTTVADIEAVPELLPSAWQSTPLRVFSFLEMTGVRSRRDPVAILREAVTKAESMPQGKCRVGLSPHAPYSAIPRLLRACAEAARERGWPLCTHVAESAEEFEMFTQGAGTMYEWLARNEREMSDCGLGSPVQHLERCGLLGANLLAAHVNYLAKGDAALLAARGVSVVHCPRSHAYFRHRRFPWRKLTEAGVNICLGTDSLVTTLKPRDGALELSMFAEMRTFAHRFPAVPPETILRLVTVNAARALGRQRALGELTPGAGADVIAVPFTGRASEVYAALVDHPGPVAASMIEGEWVIPPPQLNA